MPYIATRRSNDSLTLTVHRAVTAVSALAASPSPLQFNGDPILTLLGGLGMPRHPE